MRIAVRGRCRGGTAGPVDGQAMLEALEEMNLFVIPLDDERHWYRYHHLFADVLRKRLEHQYPQMLPELHRRASQWYEQERIYRRNHPECHSWQATRIGLRI